MADICLKIFFISRPRIWLYTLGSFLFGVHLAVLLGYTVDGLSVLLVCAALTVPVNLFIYALNDYFDADSDEQNPKKDHFEHRSDSTDGYLLYLAATSLLLVGCLMVTQEAIVIQLFLLWVFIILTYNIPPLRFKARPGLDMLFAVNFPLWGFIGYGLVAHELPDLLIVVPIALLSSVFHLYTAVHDIPYDKKSGVITSAVYVGSVKNNMYICVILTILTMVSLVYLGWFWVAVPLVVYLGFFLLHLTDSVFIGDLLCAYRYFIWIHYIVGILVSVSLLVYV